MRTERIAVQDLMEGDLFRVKRDGPRVRATEDACVEFDAPMVRVPVAFEDRGSDLWRLPVCAMVTRYRDDRLIPAR